MFSDVVRFSLKGLDFVAMRSHKKGALAPFLIFRSLIRHF